MHYFIIAIHYISPPTTPLCKKQSIDIAWENECYFYLKLILSENIKYQNEA